MNLSTIEKFLLLAHHPKKGKFISSLTYINTGFAGCVYLELALLDKISIKKRRVFVKNNDKPVRHPILKEVLEDVKHRESPKTLKSCILSLYHKRSTYIWSYLEEMERKGLVRIENRKFLGFFPYKKSFLTNRAEQQSLISEFKFKISIPESLSIQDRALFGLIEACKLYPNLISKEFQGKELESHVKNNILDKTPIVNSIDDAVNQTIKITIATIYLTVYYVGGRSSRFIS